MKSNRVHGFHIESTGGAGFIGSDLFVPIYCLTTAGGAVVSEFATFKIRIPLMADCRCLRKFQ